MKIVFMGSSAFAVPSLKFLLKTKHEITLVVCQPDKPSGRGLKIHSCPVALFAKEQDLKIFQPKSLRKQETKQPIIDLKPDLIVVVAYGKILPTEILRAPRLGCVNVHASLLPKYRGAAPINWAIVNGEQTTGVTTMFINEEMDEGDILLQKETEIKSNEIASELSERLSSLGASLLIETIEGLEKDTVSPRPQDHAKATYAPLLKKENGLINWNQSAKEISNHIRGLQPWPIAFTHIQGKMMRIFKAQANQEETDKRPGTIISADENLVVATSMGTLYLLEVQLEGKKRMPVDAFLRGHQVISGEVLK